MTTGTPRLSLWQLNAIARDAVDPKWHAVIAAVPSRGGSDYAEIIVCSSEKQNGFMTVGVRRSQSADQIRSEIMRRVRRSE